MADAANLFDLAAKISVDTSKSDKALTDTQKKVLSLADSFKGLDKATAVPSAGLDKIAGAIPAITAGATIGAAAVGALVTSFLALVKHAADVAGGLKDMSDKTNYAVETLSTLQVAGRRTDVDLSGLSASLIIFQKNQGAASGGNASLAKTFKDLNIDVRDNEKGLRDAFAALHKMGEGQQQTATGAKLFGRNIKDVQAILKETNGDIDAAMERYSKLGLIISTEMALAADDFTDTWQNVVDQVDAGSRAIVSKSLPAFTVFFEDMSRTLAASANEWSFWADVVKGSVAGVLGGIQGLVEYIASRGTLTLDIAISSSIQSILQRSSQAEALNLMEATTGRASRMAGAGLGGGGGGGRGGGGGGKQRDVLQGLKSALMGLNTEYRKYSVALLDSANLTSLAAEKEKLLASVMSSLKDATKQKISGLKDVDAALETAIGSLPKKSQAAAQALLDQSLAQFKVNEEMRIAVDLNKQTDGLMRQWKRDIDNTITGADEYTIAIQDLEDAYRKYGHTLAGVDRIELTHLANLQRMIALGRAAAESARNLFDMDVAGPAGEMFPANIGDLNANLSRAIEGHMGGALPPPDLAELRARMRELAGELTNVIDGAIKTGFERGIKAGFATLLQGLLDMINQIFLKRLAEGIADVLTGIGSGGGGGGKKSILGSILGAVIGGVAAGFGGGGASGLASSATSALTRASGGSVSARTPYLIGERGPELFVPGSSGNVIPNHALGGGNVTVIFQLQDAKALQSRDTQAQVARTYQRILQRRALTG